jgi:hypothetical protein
VVSELPEVPWERFLGLHEIETEIALFEQAMLGTQLRERSQAFFFFFTKAESKMFAIIAAEKIGIGCFEELGRRPRLSLRNQLVEIRKIFITQGAKAARDRFRIRNFGANQPGA